MADEFAEQTALYEIIIGYQSVMLKTPKDKRSISWFKTQLEGLEKLWNEYFQGHKQLIRVKAEYIEEQYFAHDLYALASTQYNLTKALLLNTINPGRSTSSIQADTSYADTSLDPPSYKTPLPTIKLPRFSGNKLEWETYNGMFIALVHDVPTIPPILKLQYLIRSLSGDAANRLKNVRITPENYTGAWQAMLDINCSHVKCDLVLANE